MCGGSNTTVDCAGSCFGSALIDDCGICAGGTTGRVANADKDCKGVCFGTATACKTAPDSSGAAATASVVVIVRAVSAA